MLFMTSTVDYAEGAAQQTPWPSLIKMDAAVKAKMEKLFNPWQPMNSLEEIFPANSHTPV
jgi:hypothetical protein